MKLVGYSTKKYQETNVGWFRTGDHISYFANGIARPSTSSKSFYTLRFSHTFEYSNDGMYFAYSYPYTYTQLVEFLNAIEFDATIRRY